MTDLTFVNQALDAATKLQRAERDRNAAMDELTRLARVEITSDLGSDVLRNLEREAATALQGRPERVISLFGLLNFGEQCWRQGRHHTQQQVARMGWLATRIEQALTLAEDLLSAEEKSTLEDAAAVIRRMRGPVDGEDGHGTGTG